MTEAERLAYKLENNPFSVNLQAADELRRLSDENKNLRTVAKKYIGWIGIDEPDSCIEIDLKDNEMIGKNND